MVSKTQTTETEYTVLSLQNDLYNDLIVLMRETIKGNNIV